MIQYKLFRIKNGKLYPLYVYRDQALETGVWLKAQEGPKTENGKVKSKLGELAYRPGFHCCEFPLADHIGVRAPDGTLLQRKNSVWCEVEINDNNDYTSEILKTAKNSKDAYLRHLPENGYYWYKTNPNAKIRWCICDQIKINRILPNDEVDNICKLNNLKAQKRQ